MAADPQEPFEGGEMKPRGATSSGASTVLELTKRVLFNRASVVLGALVVVMMVMYYHVGSDTRQGTQEFAVTEPEAVTISIKQDLRERKLLYENECKKGTPSGHVAEMFVYPGPEGDKENRVSVCHVPKAGCTFWKKVMRFLYKDFKDGKEVKTMWDMDRTFVHFSEPSNKYYKLQEPEGKKLADESLKVMFTRDPYQRLWSSYVDKFMLPDSWADHGKAIMFSRHAKRPGTHKACPDDITFEEFLQYALRLREAHWQPISDVCDPCTFKPDIVGHVESFSRDSAHVLDEVHLGHLLEGKTEHGSYAEDEMKNLIDYHYLHWKKRPSNRDCMNEVELAQILWRVFQVNGYFRHDNHFPKKKVEEAVVVDDLDLTRENVIKVFITRYRADPLSKEEWRQQREQVVAEAWQAVSDETKNAILERFRRDFELFGYSMEFPKP